jgi:hypothetical protein
VCALISRQKPLSYLFTNSNPLSPTNYPILEHTVKPFKTLNDYFIKKNNSYY